MLLNTTIIANIYIATNVIIIDKTNINTNIAVIINVVTTVNI